MSYLYLGIAISAELLATISLKESKQFSVLIPSLLVVVGYGAAFYFMSLSMRTIPVSISYAIWSAMGICLITLASSIRFGEIPDLPAIAGILLIVAGVVCLTGFSKMSVH